MAAVYLSYGYIWYGEDVCVAFVVNREREGMLV